jgi:hypothetical protein
MGRLILKILNAKLSYYVMWFLFLSKVTKNNDDTGEHLLGVLS